MEDLNSSRDRAPFMVILIDYSALKLWAPFFLKPLKRRKEKEEILRGEINRKNGGHKVVTTSLFCQEYHMVKIDNYEYLYIFLWCEEIET
jgi:hypothetical protein